MSKRYFKWFYRLGIFCSVTSGTLLNVASTPAEVEGKYTSWVNELLNTGSFTKLQNALPTATTPVHVTCLQTSHRRFYIGVAQNMIVEAPLERVEKIIEDIDQYSELFPGFAHVKVVSREPAKPADAPAAGGNQAGRVERWITSWEQKIPVFFIPNIKYEMIYFLGPGDANRKVYRYQLNHPGTIKESDGMIVLEKISAQETRYTEIDFFDAKWGILESVAPESIWKDAVDGIYLSDLAIKFKAVRPELSSKQAREAAEKTMEKLEKLLKKTPGQLCSEQKTERWDERFPGLPLPPP